MSATTSLQIDAVAAVGLRHDRPKEVSCGFCVSNSAQPIRQSALKRRCGNLPPVIPLDPFEGIRKVLSLRRLPRRVIARVVGDREILALICQRYPTRRQTDAVSVVRA